MSNYLSEEIGGYTGADQTDLQAVLDPYSDRWARAQGNETISLAPAFTWPRGTLDIQMGYASGQPFARPTNPASLMPSAMWVAARATNIFHVDPVNGNDANTGIGSYIGDFASATALKSLATAITKANAVGTACRILVKADTHPWMTRVQSGVGAGVFPTVSLSVEAIGGRLTLTGSDAHTWAVDGTYGNCYSATESNASGAVDLLNLRWIGEKEGARLLDRAGAGRQANVELVLYASPTALNAAAFTGSTGGGYVNSGGKTYVRRADGAAVTDSNTRVLRGNSTVAPAFSTHTTSATSTSASIYMSGVDFHGGFSSINAGTRNIWLDNCRGMYVGLDVGSGANAFGFDFIGTALLTRCEGWSCGNDGINGHGFNGQLNMAAFNCLAWDLGRNTQQSNNALTAHETVCAFDFAGNYQLSRGGTVRCINDSSTYLFGTRVLGDLGDGFIIPSAIMANNNAQMFLKGCEVSADNRAMYAPDANSRIYNDSSRVLSGSTTGNVVSAGLLYTETSPPPPPFKSTKNKFILKYFFIQGFSIFAFMSKPIKLPRYIVEKSGIGYVMWDTWKHTYIPYLMLPDKNMASEKAKQLNEGG